MDYLSMTMDQLADLLHGIVLAEAPGWKDEFEIVFAALKVKIAESIVSADLALMWELENW